MAINTYDYNELVSAVRAAYEDDGTEFLNHVPWAINITERKMARDLQTHNMLNKYEEQQLLADELTATVSADVAVLRDVHYKTSGDGEWNLLERRTDDYLLDYWPYQAGVSNAAEIKYYSWDAYNDTLRFAPARDGISIIQYRYQKHPQTLTSANTSNEFTNFAPNALYFGVMAEMSLFDKNWQTYQIWDQRYQEEISRLRDEGSRIEQDDSTANYNPSPSDLGGT